MSSRRILRNRFLFSLAAGLFTLLTINQTSQAQISGFWQKVGTHPQASQQPTHIGGQPTVAQYLWNLKSWNGCLYAGYGDSNLNGVSALSTQFAVTPFDPGFMGGFFPGNDGVHKCPPYPGAVTPFQFPAEAVPLYREIAGVLYAPNMDATDPGRSPRNFASSGKNPITWIEHVEKDAVHILDMATLTGTDIWMVGADCVVSPALDCNKSNAVAWRSTDGGASFQEVLRPALREGFNVSRFYFAGVLHNRLYLQVVDVSATAREVRPTSLVFDGSTWSDGPDLFPRRNLDLAAYGYQPTYFNNEMVYLTRYSFEGDVPAKDLMVFNGINSRHVYLPQGVRNFTVAGNYIYVLAPDGQVRRTTNLTVPWAQWETISSFTLADTL